MSRSLRLARLLISSLEDRISLLSKKYPSVPESTIRELASLDPTHGSLLEWLTRQVKSGQFRFPEDSFRMSPALSTFLQLKKSPRLLQQHSASPDINKYTFHSLEDLHDKISGVELKSQRQTIEESKSKAAKTIYDTPPYKIIQIGGPDTDLDAAVQAACTYAKHTRWCTSKPEGAKFYLSKAPLYVIFKNGIKVAQTDGTELMNLKDQGIAITKAPKLWKLLSELDIISPALYSYLYAHYVIQKPFSPGEPVLLQSAKLSYYYARDVLKAPFPLGEPTISQSPEYSYKYALQTLKAPFPLGEPTISQSPIYAYFYAAHVLQAPFPSGEPAISKSSEYSFKYARDVLKAPFLLGEPAISNSIYKNMYFAMFPSRAISL
jgi:hypothetical protein